MANKKHADISQSLKAMLKKKPSEDVAEKISELGVNAHSNSDAIAAALLSKAVKGEITAIKQVNDMLKSADKEPNKTVSKLYSALEKENG